MVVLGQRWRRRTGRRFAGRNALGVSDNPNLPLEWSDKKNVEWKAAVPGLGWSGPVVHSGRVYLTTALSDGEFEKRKPGLYFGGERREPIKHMHHFLVLCLSWRPASFFAEGSIGGPRPLTPIHVKNSYAAETPVTDGERVYAYFGSHGLYCLDTSGKVIWEKCSSRTRCAMLGAPVRRRFSTGTS